MSDPRTFAFVFARGGSKGLPGKNLLVINGHPLLAHSILVAQQIKCINSIYVSTDCPLIAQVGASYGADIIARPAQLASDTAAEWLAWQHAIEYVQSKEGVFDRFVSLPPTAPCRSVDDVQRCLNALTPEVDLVLSTSPSRHSPWFNMVTEDSQGYLQLVNHGEGISRRQDAPACSDIATVAYVSRPSFILGSQGLWDGKVLGVDIPYERAIDIDTPVDYAIACFLMEQYLALPVEPANV